MQRQSVPTQWAGYHLKPCQANALQPHYIRSPQLHRPPSRSLSNLAILLSSSPSLSPLLCFLPFLPSSPPPPPALPPPSLDLFLPLPPPPAAAAAIRCASLSNRSRLRASRS